MSPSHADLAISIGSGSYWYQATAATGTVNQFLGRSNASDDTEGNSGSRDGRLRRSVNANGPLRLKHHSAVALTWQHAEALSPQVDLVGALRLEYGRTRWFIKDGIDILRDDLTLKTQHLSLSPTLALRRNLHAWGHWNMDVAGGIGAQALVARTHITSALLNVRRTEHFSDHFAFIRMAVAHVDAPSDRVVLDMQWRKSTALNLRLGVEHRF
ncbi:MAG: hypothetical protein ABJJ53_09845 [Sulfitobacter sp.]